MALRGPGRPSNKGRAVRYIGAGLLLLLGGYFAYEFMAMQHSDSLRGVSLISSCPNQPNTTLHRIYAKNPALSIDMFTFEHDTVSKEVQDHSARQFHLGHHLAHKFYAKTLCAASGSKLSPKKGCQGLVLDVGAFIGTHALVLAKLGFDVHAFEPQRHAVELLRCSAAANEFNLTAVAEGVSDEMGKECFINPMVAAMHQAMTAPKLLTKLGCDEGSKVPVVTLDHYWENVLRKQQVLFVKMDAEGHEPFVFKGASKMMSTAPPAYILMEYYPHVLTLKNVTSASLMQMVYGYGYRVYDCNKKVEVPDGPKGEVLLKPYAMSFSLTDLLLIHSSHAPQGDLTNKFECAY